MIDLAKLKKELSKEAIDQLVDTATKYHITDPLEMSHFLAQAAHESQGFTRTTENLNYSAVRLLQVFPKYFDGANAEEYAGDPIRIASRVYAHRNGNGDEESRDGWTFRGRGYIQLTGRANYTGFDLTLTENIVDNPGLVATKYPILSAGWYWPSRGIKGAAMQGDSPAVVEAVTRLINGGKIGLDDRIQRFNHYYGLLKNG